MTTIEDILRLSGMAPPSEPPYEFAPEPAAEVNLTALMAEPCFEIAAEFKARIEQSNGLDMVDTHTLESIVDSLLLELCLRGIVVSYPVLGHGD